MHMVVKTAPEQYSEVEISLLHGFTVRVATEENARAALDQSGGIYNTYCTVARDLRQRKLPLSSGYALGFGSVYRHKSRATGK